MPNEDSKLLVDDNTKIKKSNGCSSCGGYPKSVFFILGNEFCERFSFYGMKAILVIYLTNWLSFSDDLATAIFHTFSMLCYFTPVFGGMLSDSFLGKYKTILYLSCVYMVGNIVMATTAVPPPEVYGPMIGLFLIGVGTGGIKPCVAAFGGDQFEESQEQQLSQFFSIFYFIINVGSLLSMLITPLLRTHVTCFDTNCFAVAFGVPAALMLLSLVLFVIGRRTYKVIPPSGNIVARMFGCIGHALSNKCKLKKTATRDHWLDYADDIYEPKFIGDVRAALHVLLMFIPLPIFWALFDQQGSRWTLQAIHMNGEVGPFHLQPDQMQAINPVLIILLIPVFEGAIYPLLSRCNVLTRPLQRMCTGMVLAAAAFVVAGFIQLKIDASSPPPLPHLKSEVRIFNTAPCPVSISSEFYTNTLEPNNGTDVLMVDVGQYDVTFSADQPCGEMTGVTTASLSVRLTHDVPSFVVIGNQQGDLIAKQFEYEIPMVEKGGALVSLVYAGQPIGTDLEVELESEDGKNSYSFNVSTFGNTSFLEVTPTMYALVMPLSASQTERVSTGIDTNSGGVYTVIVHQNGTSLTSWDLERYVLRAPNQVSILLQIPQYFLITAGEVMFSVTGLHFAYSQAPQSMKSVLQAGWLTTVAFGNLIVVIVAETQLIHSQAGEFFLFACLMGLDMFIFAIMAYFYVYVDHSPDYVNFSGDKPAGTTAEDDKPRLDDTDGAVADKPIVDNAESHM